jgi:hypothetical protein
VRNDPVALLAAVREALRQQSMALEVRTRPDPDPTPQEEVEQTRRLANERLEAAAFAVAAAQLDKNARELRDPQESPDKAVEKAKETLWACMKKLMASGWRITVGAVLDWATKSK